MYKTENKDQLKDKLYITTLSLVTTFIDQQVGIITWQLEEPRQSGEIFHCIFTVISISKVLWDPPPNKQNICTSDISSIAALPPFSQRILAEEGGNQLKTMRPASTSTVLWKFRAPVCSPSVYSRMDVMQGVSTALVYVFSIYISIKMTGSSEKLSSDDELIQVNFLLCKLAIFSFLPRK